jgi:protein TIF31
MVTRAAKHEFARLLRGVEAHELAHAVSHFLNCLLGDAKASTAGVDLNTLAEEDEVSVVVKENSAEKGKKKKGKKGTSQQQQQPQQQQAQQPPREKKLVVPKGEIFNLTSQSLWKNLQALVKERYDYDISAPVAEEKESKNLNEVVRKRVRDLPTLRSFCLKVGVQVAARNYDFSAAEPFRRKDILDIYPLVKHLNPKVPF